MRQASFRSSHFRPIPGKPKPLGVAAAAAQGLILPPPPRRERKTPPLLHKPLAKVTFIRPRDGVVRAVASDAAKAHVDLHWRTLPAKSVRSYCEAALHYGGRYVVEEYVYLALIRKIDEHRARVMDDLDKLYVRLGRKSRKLQTQVSRLKMRLAHDSLKRMAEDAFREIEDSIRSMAVNGRRLKERSVHGYLLVKGTIPMHGAVCYILVDDSDGSLKVVRAMTVEEYKKSCRERRKQKTARNRQHLRKPFSQHPRRMLH